MTRKQRRLTLILSSLGVLAVAAFLVLSALEDSIVFFHSPTEIIAKNIPVGENIRMGGLVEDGSVNRSGGENISFSVTDTNLSRKVEFTGILPALFREGQGVVVEGALRDDGVFQATNVLAKHDENYMPPEVVDVLEDAGYMKDGEIVETDEQPTHTD